MTASPLDWYAARAAGIVAYLLLTVVVLIGLTLSGQLRRRDWPRFAVTDVHRFGGLLVAVFVSIHVLTIALDSYTPFSLSQLLVPLRSDYRPLWTALGIVAAELLVALAVTNALRTRIPYLWWRRIHILNVVVWGAATVHGIGAGTDSRSVWMVLTYIVAVSSVLAGIVWRTARRRLAPRAVGGLAGAAGLLGIAAVLALAATPHSSAAHPGTVAPATRFTDSFGGSLTRIDGAAGSMLSVLGRGTGTRAVLLRIDLVTSDGQSISGTALQLEDITSGSICTGTISSVNAGGFAGACRFTDGSSRAVSGVWRLSAGQLSGSLSVEA